MTIPELATYVTGTEAKFVEFTAGEINLNSVVLSEGGSIEVVKFLEDLAELEGMWGAAPVISGSGKDINFSSFNLSDDTLSLV